MGGEQSSSKRPGRNLKGGNSQAPDLKALLGAEILGTEKYTAFEGHMVDYQEDIDYGLPSMGSVAGSKNGPETQGNQGWGKAKTDGSPSVPDRSVKGSSDPTPGGGW